MYFENMFFLFIFVSPNGNGNIIVIRYLSVNFKNKKFNHTKDVRNRLIC